MKHVVTTLVALALSLSSLARADETVRQVQEELRKRNLYFGNIDGQPSPVLTDALKRYQTRKGFAITGRLDQDTTTSLHIRTSTVASTATLPDMPVLKSDIASALPESQRLALQREAEEKGGDLSPTPPAPAESPPANQDLSPDRVSKFVQDYLRDAEGQDVPAQVRYYAFPVRYFDHGLVSEQFVSQDTGNYVKRWPQRKYILQGPVNFFASGKEGETEIEFTIAFDLRNGARTAKSHAVGRTKNWWTVRMESDEMKIIAIREERVRE
jgi:peptidoglycan hydrolase-like protein with peptidoglycan-binding domain